MKIEYGIGGWNVEVDGQIVLTTHYASDVIFFLRGRGEKIEQEIAELKKELSQLKEMIENRDK